jgi:hypothetical protein
VDTDIGRDRRRSRRHGRRPRRRLLSNQGQEQQFEDQRKAARDDLRQDAYANYLQEGFGYLVQLEIREAGVTVTEDELKARLDATAGAQAAVALFGNPEFKTLTTNLTNALAGEDTTTADALLSRYIVLAKEDLDLGTGE